MLLRFLILTLFTTTYLFAQQKGLRFVDYAANSPVADADVYTDSSFVATTNYNGNVKVDIGGKYKNLIVDHIAYEKRIIPRDSLLIKKVYRLKKRTGILNEVVIDKQKLNDSAKAAYYCCGHGMMAARFVTGPDNSIITKLKFRVETVHGVKGLNFLPFKANVYELDSITKLPGKPLLPHDVLVENKAGDDWAVVDISAYRLKLPPRGACLVFIIPGWDEYLYNPRFIWSKVGQIDAVPHLKVKNAPSVSGSYVYTGPVFQDPDYNNNPVLKWRFFWGKHCMIEAVFANAD